MLIIGQKNSLLIDPKILGNVTKAFLLSLEQSITDKSVRIGVDFSNAVDKIKGIHERKKVEKALDAAKTNDGVSLQTKHYESQILLAYLKSIRVCLEPFTREDSDIENIQATFNDLMTMLISGNENSFDENDIINFSETLGTKIEKAIATGVEEENIAQQESVRIILCIVDFTVKKLGTGVSTGLMIKEMQLVHNARTEIDNLISKALEPFQQNTNADVVVPFKPRPQKLAR